MRKVIKIILWLLVLYGAYSLVRTYLIKPESNVSSMSCVVDEARLLYLINEERKEQKVRPLTYSKQLSISAEMKAIDMYEHNYWGHVSPDGVEPWGFFLSAGYDYTNAGENLAREFCGADDLFEAWKNSKEHYENMISDHFEEIGIGIYRQYAVNHFGRQ